MTIDEALYELESPDDLTYCRHTAAFNEALKLGIEALKRVKWNRKNYAVYRTSLLPGETEN